MYSEETVPKDSLDECRRIGQKWNALSKSIDSGWRESWMKNRFPVDGDDCRFAQPPISFSLPFSLIFTAYFVTKLRQGSTSELVKRSSSTPLVSESESETMFGDNERKVSGNFFLMVITATVKVS